jgi:hypothetical protein
MKKTLIVTLCVLLGLPALASAAEGADEAIPSASQPKARSRCVFPDSPRESAPLWVCSKQAPGIALAAVGSHKKSKAGVQFTKDQAVASARGALAQSMTQQLGRKLRGYAAQQKLGGAAANKLITPAFEQLTRQSLVGSRIVQQATSRKGTIYVLVGIDPEQASQATRDIVKGAAGQEPALWQPVKGKQSAEELASAVAAE